MRWGLLIFIFIFATTTADAKHKRPEREYVSEYCDGMTEVILPDRTRVDCLTDEYAIEFDFAPKWAEAFGQSLHYAYMTGRAPGIYLILESDKDMRFVDILKQTVRYIWGRIGVNKKLLNLFIWIATPAARNDSVKQV